MGGKWAYIIHYIFLGRLAPFPFPFRSALSSCACKFPHSLPFATCNLPRISLMHYLAVARKLQNWPGAAILPIRFRPYKETKRKVFYFLEFLWIETFSCAVTLGCFTAVNSAKGNYYHHPIKNHVFKTRLNVYWHHAGCCLFVCFSLDMFTLISFLKCFLTLSFTLCFLL